MKKLMHLLARLFPEAPSGENPFAVKMFYRMTAAKQFLGGLNKSSTGQWPFYSGHYKVINPQGQIAVCTLTSEDLLPDELLCDKIAIVGTLMTPNLGIERIIHNVTDNPNIRHLLLCGKDSPVLKAGQAMECLFAHGIDREKRIIEASGHYPVLSNLPKEKIEQFLEQIELTSMKEEKQSHLIKKKIDQLQLSEERFGIDEKTTEEESFTGLKAGGKRVPLDYDKKGFFVISVDQDKREITVKHYFKDNKPGHLVKGRSAESILLALLKEDLVSQMSHAGYLGAELAKAETAIKLKLKYTQDRPLKKL